MYLFFFIETVRKSRKAKDKMFWQNLIHYGYMCSQTEVYRHFPKLQSTSLYSLYRLTACRLTTVSRMMNN